MLLDKMYRRWPWWSPTNLNLSKFCFLYPIILYKQPGVKTWTENERIPCWSWSACRQSRCCTCPCPASSACRRGRRGWSADRSRSTRLGNHSQLLPITPFQYARTDIRKRSFAVRVVEGWNRLPDQVKMTASKDVFKRTLQKTTTS